VVKKNRIFLSAVPYNIPVPYVEVVNLKKCMTENMRQPAGLRHRCREELHDADELFDAGKDQ